MAKLTAKLLGSPAVFLDGKKVAFSYRKADALLYYVLIRRRAARGEAASLLWEEVDTAAALKNLRHAVYTIRKGLGFDIFTPGQNAALELDPAVDIRCDVWDLLEQGDLSAYAGEFLEGFSIPRAGIFDDWLQEQRGLLQTQYLKNLLAQEREALAQGDLTRAESLGTKYVHLDPLEESAAAALMEVYSAQKKYRKAIDLIRSQLETQPRTKEGNFWHKDIYPWQVWLDGTYMAQPFYMEYETRFNKMQGCIDSYKQFMNIRRHMRDPKTGLYYHGYDESRAMYWADPETGCSPNFWLRAMGWFMVAMVDVLERMDEQLYNEYRGIQAMLKQTIEDVHKFQDEETGMFWQVMDHPGVEGNYLETSGTALFAYAVLKGVRLGLLPKRMAAWAEKAFYGTCDKYLSKNPDGSLQLDGICLVAGLGGKDHRDGSLAYYFSEPVVCNDAKGVGPLVLAYTEMIARK